MSESKSLRIVELRSENIKRLSAVTVRPDGNVVIIGGQNGQGKTSLLDSIEMALGGGKTIPVEPVRRGSRKARIVADLGEIIVERTFTPKGTTLEVRNKEGVPQRSPQALLDQLCSKVSFDPLAFAREEPKKQDEILKSVLGLDFSDLETRRENAYAERRDLNRDGKSLYARLDAMTPHIGVPKEEVSVAELTAELERLRDVADENRNKREQLEAAGDTAQERMDEVERQRWKIECMREGLVEAEKELVFAEQMALHASEHEAKIRVQVEALSDPDMQSIREQIESAEETNRKIRENKEYAKLSRQASEITTRIDALSEQIESIRDEKQERLAAAKFPVPGLGFDDSGPTLNEIPLSQSSQAERLRVSVAVGLAFNPKLRVMLIREGAFLDEDALALLSELAEKADAQVFIERVGTADKAAIIIEDGMVAESEERGAAE